MASALSNAAGGAMMGGGGSNPFQVMSNQAGSQMRTAKFNRMLALDQWEWQKKMYQQKSKLTGGLMGLIDQWNTSYAEAREANEQRYNEMLGITDNLRDVRSDDISSQYAGRESEMRERLQGIGAGNTTIGDTMSMGIERERQDALDRSKLAHAGTRLGIMERRTDKYPDQNLILGLVQALGQGGGGMEGLSEALGNMKLG